MMELKQNIALLEAGFLRLVMAGKSLETGKKKGYFVCILCAIYYFSQTAHKNRNIHLIDR